MMRLRRSLVSGDRNQYVWERNLDLRLSSNTRSYARHLRGHSRGSYTLGEYRWSGYIDGKSSMF